MPRLRPLRVPALACLLVLAAPSPTAARPLFGPRTGDHPGLAGIDRVQALTIDRRALADLRASANAVLDAFPLGDGSTATLVLRRFSPFSPEARAEVMTPDGPKPMALPDAAYFTGTVDGDPTSLALVVAGADEAHGFVATGGDVHLFGPEQGLRHRALALRNVDPSQYPPPRDFCLNDLRRDDLPAVPRPLLADAPPVAATGALKVAEIAIETDNELRAKFASDQATLDWLGTLLAATTVIYERDVTVQLQFSYVRIWSTGVTDPWTATDTYNSLMELQGHWNTPANPVYSVGRDLVHFVSGKSVTGGIAYVNVLCNASFAYGVSQVYGSFDLTNPFAIWDVEVFAHELGHNFGSPHTHCYSPPVDQCYGSEGGGCYSGPAISSQGTIMSYCHLHAGGLSNITLAFGSTVSTRIGQSVDAASCLATATTTTTTSTTTTTTAGGTTTTTSAGTTTTTGGTTTTATTTTTTTTSTTTSTAASTTTTTLPEVEPQDGDEDEDGVADEDDACEETPAGDLVDASGCSVCPCAGPREGGTWRNRLRYLRCVRTASRARAGAADFDPHAALRHAQKSSCARRGVTRCCVETPSGAVACRLTKASTCAAKSESGFAEDLGGGSCLPTPCE